MRRFWFQMLIPLVLLLVIVPLGACVKTSHNEGKIPQRIISLAPSNTEILFALGLGDKIVGVTKYCNYPPEAQQKPKIGGFSDVDIEKVIELNPDLVLATGMHEKTVTPELEKRGVKVITLAPANMEDVLKNIIQVGKATGKSAEAEQLVSTMRSRIEAISQKVALLTDDQKPRVFYITWHDPIWTLGKGTLTNELIEAAGGTNIFADAKGNFQTNLETVIDRNPQVILASTGHGSEGDSPFNWAQNEDRLRQTDARRNDKVYKVNSDLVTRPGPRMVEGLELIAGLLHPEIFGNGGQ